MSRVLSEGQLSGIIRSAGTALVAVDFSNEGCPPCRAIRPWWDSLPKKYPKMIFCTVMCSDCPGDAQSHGIRATPTFVFFLNGKEVGRVQGARKDQILQILEKHKDAGNPFAGKGHSLSETKPVVKKEPMVDTYNHDMLLEMGFPIAKVNRVTRALPNGTIDDCVLMLEQMQLQEESKKSPETAPHQPSLTETQLIEMGFDPATVRQVIERVGDSIELCIEELARQAEKPKADPAAQAAELKKKLDEKKRADAQARPKTEANEELERRAAVHAQLEARKQAEQRRETPTPKTTNQDIIERQQIRDRIRANREAAHPPTRASTSPGQITRTDCTLKLILPNGEEIIEKFQADDTLEIVSQFVRQNGRGLARNIGFETTFPKQVIGKERFGETLRDLQLVPRAQLHVRNM